MGYKSIIRFIIISKKYQFENYFSSKWKIFKAIGIIISILMLMFNVYLINLITSNTVNLNIHKELIFVFYIVFNNLIILLYGLIPSVKNTFGFLPNYFPIGKKQKIFISVFLNIINNAFLLIFVFFLILYFTNTFFTFTYLLSSIFLVLISFLLNYSFKNYILGYYIKRNISVLFLIFCTTFYLCVFFVLYKNLITLYHLLFYLLLLIFLLFMYNVFSVNFYNIYENNKRSKVSFKNIFISLLIENKQIFSSLKIGILYKVIILIIFSLVYYLHGIYFLPKIFLFITLAPIAIFTYFLNNVFGFKRKIFLAITSFPFERFHLFYVYFLLSIPLILIDYIVSILFAYTLNLINFNIIVFYLNSTIILLLNGLYFTIKKAVPIPELTSYKISNKNVSMIGNIISLIFVIILSLLKGTSSISLSILFFGILMLLIKFNYYENLFENHKYKLYRILFSNEK